MLKMCCIVFILIYDILYVQMIMSTKVVMSAEVMLEWEFVRLKKIDDE